MLQMYSPVSSSTADDISSELSDRIRCLDDEGRATNMAGDEDGEKVQVTVMLVRGEMEEEQAS